MTTAFGVYVALFVAVGAPALTSVTGLLTLVQSHADPAVRGRVLSTLMAVMSGVQAGGMMVAGVVGTGAGLTTALEAQAAAYLVAALLARRLIAQPPRVRAGTARGWISGAGPRTAAGSGRAPTA